MFCCCSQTFEVYIGIQSFVAFFFSRLTKLVFCFSLPFSTSFRSSKYGRNRDQSSRRSRTRLPSFRREYDLFRYNMYKFSVGLVRVAEQRTLLRDSRQFFFRGGGGVTRNYVWSIQNYVPIPTVKNVVPWVRHTYFRSLLLMNSSWFKKFYISKNMKW